MDYARKSYQVYRGSVSDLDNVLNELDQREEIVTLTPYFDGFVPRYVLVTKTTIQPPLAHRAGIQGFG